MVETLDIDNFFQLAKTIPVADVRSPSEYLQGHIPGAINLPLFSDMERKEVGTLYKQSGREKAIYRGFEIIGGKYSELLSECRSLAKEDELLLYCWRGGMRSATLAWLLNIQGIKARIIKGGYKSYRRYLRNYFAENFQLRILGGMTGSGKTEILVEMKSFGCQVVDLEAIACHKGSAFGALGERPQPTTEQFENLLLYEFMQLNREEIIWLEDESPNIGKVFLPPELYARMKASQLVKLEIPREIRIERLVMDYSRYRKEELLACMGKITRKVGGMQGQLAKEALENNDFHTFAGIALNYYDKTYRFSLDKRKEAEIVEIKSGTGNARVNAERILKLNPRNF